ncbi:Fic family protein [Bermanella marisrubri]|uniref:Fic family protein n=1 Tax=Bermanella marisrubri TaxID=207949 RepID=Q1N108_9GAMM|nr:Fic family protein [Bermanella marisrubri]EAT11866.1 Fic family protein [Oceanobacter sp. RED65] [Bermanella marisrubri]
MQQWIWQKAAWPHFTWSKDQVAEKLNQTEAQLQSLLSKAGALSDEDILLDTLLQNVLSSSAIEEEFLNAESVRSSLAKRLDVSANAPVSDRSEGVAQLMMDVVDNVNEELTLDRLFHWHRWLFPESVYSLAKLRVGQLRGDEPMQVVSGRLDRPVVHFEAPPKSQLVSDLSVFIKWFEESRQDNALPDLVRVALVHFWFITLHPFDDGNGRIARALTDLALGQAYPNSTRLLSLSLSILNDRKGYYEILERCQKSGLDVSEWIQWFLDSVLSSIQHSEKQIERSRFKARFWKQHVHHGLNKEQIKVLNRLLDGGEKGFEHGISASQYQKVAKVSKATATRHLSDLVRRECLQKLPRWGTKHSLSH